MQQSSVIDLGDGDVKSSFRLPSTCGIVFMAHAHLRHAAMAIRNDFQRRKSEAPPCAGASEAEDGPPNKRLIMLRGSRE
jgi:hypothetical protein